MENYIVMIIGILLLIVAIIWMLIGKASTGPFLILAAFSGAMIEDGIHRIRKKKGMELLIENLMMRFRRVWNIP